jgi:hypothetical protein
MDGVHDNGVRRDGGAREKLSRAPGALVSDAEPPLRAAFDVRPLTVKASRVAVPPRVKTGDAVLARSQKDLRGGHPGDTLFWGLTLLMRAPALWAPSSWGWGGPWAKRWP